MTVHHFVSDQDHDLKFLAHAIAKADEIREDLGSANFLMKRYGAATLALARVSSRLASPRT